jgi:hypothetical protein
VLFRSLETFNNLLKLYSEDPDATKRLNAFVLRSEREKGDMEEIYANMPNFVRSVADGRMDYAKAKAQYNVADDVFARLGIFDRELMKFVYTNSKIGPGGYVGMLRWLRDNAKSIKNGTEVVKLFQRNSSQFIGMIDENPNKVEGKCADLISQKTSSYEKEEESREGKWAKVKGFFVMPKTPERWYVQTAEPFNSWTVRDVVPRKGSIVTKPTPPQSAPVKVEATPVAGEDKLRTAVHKALFPKPRRGPAPAETPQTKELENAVVDRLLLRVRRYNGDDQIMLDSGNIKRTVAKDGSMKIKVAAPNSQGFKELVKNVSESAGKKAAPGGK